MIQLLLANPLLLLFVVAAIGYPLGRIKVAGSSLGVASVLFVGLGVGSLHPDLKLPEIVYLLGLVLFVYTVGLSSGAGFFASFRAKGVRDSLLVLGVLGLAAALTVVAFAVLGLKPTTAAGLFAGSLTNTPALAGVLDYVKGVAPAGAVDTLSAEPVVGYSIAYPMGVVGMILVMAVMRRLWRVDYAAEARGLSALGVTEPLENRTLRVSQAEVTAHSLEQLIQRKRWSVVFGRMRRDGVVRLTTGEEQLAVGDLVSVVGTAEDLERVASDVGELSAEPLTLDRREIDYRRMFVSKPQVAGRRLRDLNLPREYGAVVTRVRRGDLDILPTGDTVLELGDRVRVVTRRENLDRVSRFFGDSYRALSEIDILTFSLGIALGLLIGLVPVRLPGDIVFRLGFAGGPLVVALVLGALGRTGPLIWNLPYSANLTLRQVGLILFLASIGTRAGYSFVTTFAASGGVFLFLAGAIITCVTALVTLWIGRSLLKIPMPILIGMLAGVQTNPAILGFALEETGDDLPNIGYAAVFPIATIAKIVLAQVLLAFLLPLTR